MRTLSLVLALAAVCLLTVGLEAADKKEVTLKGTILCAKCALKETKKCTNAIQVKENGKDVVYYFKDKGTGEEYHEEVCGGGRKEGTVTGKTTVSEGKHWIVPTKVEY